MNMKIAERAAKLAKDPEYQRSADDGHEWAQATDDYRGRIIDLTTFCDGSLESSRTASETVFNILFLELNKDRRAARDFWFNISGEAAPSGVYVRGFVDGAIAFMQAAATGRD